MLESTGSKWVYWLKRGFMKGMLDVCMRQHCRIQSVGGAHIPASGGALLIGNHGAWLDGLIVALACPRRLRFVIPAGAIHNSLLQRVVTRLGALFVDPDKPEAVFTDIRQALIQGEVVCWFPEGQPTHNGQLHAFDSDFWRLLPEATPLQPFAIQGSWGSHASRASATLKRIRSRQWQRWLTVAFGKPLKAPDSIDRVKRRVFDQSAIAWNHYAAQLPSLPEAWLRSIKYNRHRVLLQESEGAAWTGQALISTVIPLARRMAEQAREQQVALLVPTSALGMLAYMAALLAGKRVMSINYTSSTESICSTLDQAQVTTLFVLDEFQQRLQQRGLNVEAMLAGRHVVKLEALLQTISRRERRVLRLMFQWLPASYLIRHYAPPVNPAESAVLLFSSGSEGAPKGVVLSHHNILANVQQTTDTLNPGDDEVILASLPLFHAFGLTVTQFLPLIEGIKVVTHPDPTDVVGLAKAIACHRVTAMCGTSTFFRLFVRNRKVAPVMLQSLREIWAGAERLRDEVRTSFRLKFQKAIYEGYGVTETSPVTSVNRADFHDAARQQVITGDRQGTVGMPAVGTSYRIADPDSWQELATGEEGMILVSGPQVMLEYLHAPERTAQVIRNIDGTRWYATGDKGRLGEDGALTIVDRYSRFAKVGGEMISLAAVERAVTDALGDTQLGVMAVDMPDTQKGEIIVALFEQEIDTAQLRRRMAQAGHHPLMVPAHCIKVDALPHLGTGKADVTTAKRMVEQHFQKVQ